MKTPSTLLLLSAITIFTVSCSKKNESGSADTPLVSVTTVTDKQGNIYSVGFDQVSSNNQDAFVQKKNASGSVVWRKIYDASPTDSRAQWIVLDQNDQPLVAFTTDGGSGGSTSFSQKEAEPGAFSGVYASGYGMGGGPRVVIAARINAETGKIIKGSYLTARLDNNQTNSIFADKIGVYNNKILLELRSAYRPPAAGETFTANPDATEENRRDGAWKLRVVFAEDFSALEESTILK